MIDWLAISTVGVLVAQTYILYRQNRIQQVQSEIQASQLQLSENVSLSAQPYFDAKANRLKVNFKNEGKGTAQLVVVRFYLDMKQEISPYSSFGDVWKLQSLGPGSTAEMEITMFDIQELLTSYVTLTISWQGTRADGKNFNGSLAEIKLWQLKTIGKT